jgi:hypothetical protein
MFVILIIFVFILFFLDTFDILLGKGQFGRVYSAFKNNNKYAIKAVNYENDDEKKMADEEEKCFILLRDSCPYLVNFVESFRDVCLYYIIIIII